MPKGVYQREITPPEERFWSKVQKTDSCWIWTACVSIGGYGKFWIGPGKGLRYIYAHRFSYELRRGKIPHGLTLDHLCKNTRCVNPDHLEAVPFKVNNARSESISGKNFRKTHCPKRHPLNGNNLVPSMLKKDGSRKCLICHREGSRKWNEERRILTKIKRGMIFLDKSSNLDLTVMLDTHHGQEKTYQD